MLGLSPAKVSNRETHLRAYHLLRRVIIGREISSPCTTMVCSYLILYDEGKSQVVFVSRELSSALMLKLMLHGAVPHLEPHSELVFVPSLAYRTGEGVKLAYSLLPLLVPRIVIQQQQDPS